MGPKTRELCDRLRETVELLTNVGADYWADWLDESLSRIQLSDLSGVDYLLRAYGGMGSFNDLMITRSNGHSVSEADGQEINMRLEVLRSALYELAADVRRNAVIEDSRTGNCR